MLIMEQSLNWAQKAMLETIDKSYENPISIPTHSQQVSLNTDHSFSERYSAQELELVMLVCGF